MTQDKVNAVVLAEIGKPVPGEPALHADDQVITIGLDQFHQSLRTSLDVLMDKDLPLRVDEADLEVFSMQVDTAVMLVCFGVESHLSFLQFVVYRSDLF